MRTALVSLLAALPCLVACRGPGASAEGGRFAIDWLGTDRQGRVVLPVEATLCRETGLVELIAVRSDTGVGLVLFPLDSATVAVQDYPVFGPDIDPELRPGANVALRWLDQVTMEAFEGIDGVVRLEPATPGLLAGTVEALLRAVERSDSLRVTGRFAEVPLDTAPEGCGSVLRRNRI